MKFWAVPDFFRNFSNCGSFHSFYIRIPTVSHWKFPQKSGRNFSVSGVFLCRIPCYNGNKPFQTCFSHIPLLFCPKEIYTRIWNDLPLGSENTVAVHIRHLREKLEINPAEPRYLKVVWGQGYKCEKQG